jgi:hypothetical protein
MHDPVRDGLVTLSHFIAAIPASNHQKLAALVGIVLALLGVLITHPPTWDGVTAGAHGAAKLFLLVLLGGLVCSFYLMHGTNREPNADFFILDFVLLGMGLAVAYPIALGFEIVVAYIRGDPLGWRRNTLYQPSQGLPPATSSQKKVLKLKALRERTDAETEYLESAHRNVKARALMKYTKQLAKRRV